MTETDGIALPADDDPDPDRDPDPDTDAAEEYAERVGVDPTHEEIDRYLQMAGEQPLGEGAPDGAPSPGDERR
jgi:hypothetical protein